MPPFQIQTFATIRLSVENVTAARNWYRQFLATEPIEDGENFVSFILGQTRFDICRADVKSPTSKGGSIGYWLVDNLESAIARAIALGGRVYRGPLEVEETRRKIVQIEDASGHVFGLEMDLK